MAQTIKLKRSATTGNVPTTSQLALGELGINTTDGKLFLKKSVSGTESIVEVGSTGSFLPLSGGTLTGNLSLGDNVKAQFGAGDLEIYSDGTSGIIKDVGSGDIKILADDFYVQNAAGSSTLISVLDTGKVGLGFAGSEKLATTSTGISISNDANFPDNGKAIFGASDDLQIYHNANNSFIQDTGTGSLFIDGSATVTIRETSTDENMAVFTGGGSASLYNNGIKN